MVVLSWFVKLQRERRIGSSGYLTDFKVTRTKSPMVRKAEKENAHYDGGMDYEQVGKDQPALV